MILTLRKDSYHSTRICANKQLILGDEIIAKLCEKSFDDILKYLQEHHYGESIDDSYTRYQGFYLIEKFLNQHASSVYKKVIRTARYDNKTFFELYYLKYQIHNLMVFVRSKISQEEDFKAYLIGDEDKKQDYIKANAMSLEDGARFLSQKLGLNHKIVLDKLSEDLFSLENYLYYCYYEQLSNTIIQYNNVDERRFYEYLRGYVDLLNARTFLRLAKEKTNNFDELFLPGGDIKKEAFKKINLTSNYEETINKLVKISEDEELDETINAHKRRSQEYFKKVRFGSPFYALQFLFLMEKEISQLRVLLKAKYSGLNNQEVKELVGVKV